MVAPILGYFWFSSAAYHISKIGESINSADLPSIDLPNLDNILPDTDQAQTADWKTYTNAEYGFEIKYPETFDAGLVDVYDPSLIGAVCLNTFDDCFKSFSDLTTDKRSPEEINNQVIKVSKFQVLNKDGFSYESIGEFPSVIDWIVIDPEHMIALNIEIRGNKPLNNYNPQKTVYPEFEKLENLNNQILSTFKFTQ